MGLLSFLPLLGGGGDSKGGGLKLPSISGLTNLNTDVSDFQDVEPTTNDTDFSILIIVVLVAITAFGVFKFIDNG